jgi:glycosyltransferase involved in cell wall biosynthesis
MRIAYVTTELRPGGAEKCLVRVARHLVEMGHQVFVFSLRPEPATSRNRQNQLVKSLADAEIPVAFGGLNGVSSLPGVRSKLKIWLADLQPDVIHSFLFHAHAAVLSCLPSNGPRWIVSERVADPRFFRRHLSKVFYGKASSICCVSNAVAGSIPQAQKFLEKTIVIHNGVDIPTVSDPPPLAEFGIPEEARLLLATGRLHPQKGFDGLIDSAPQFLQQHPEVHLVIAGEGDAREDLTRRVDHSTVAKQIHLIGHRTDIAAWQQRAEIFLLPSRWEGMSNALLEAMAAGCAVVAFDVQGVSEAITRNPEMQIAPAESWSRFVDLLNDQLVDEEKASRIGAENLVEMQERSWPAVLDQYANLYAANI